MRAFVAIGLCCIASSAAADVPPDELSDLEVTVASVQHADGQLAVTLRIHNEGAARAIRLDGQVSVTGGAGSSVGDLHALRIRDRDVAFEDIRQGPRTRRFSAPVPIGANETVVATFRAPLATAPAAGARTVFYVHAVGEQSWYGAVPVDLLARGLGEHGSERRGLCAVSDAGAAALAAPLLALIALTARRAGARSTRRPRSR